MPEPDSNWERPLTRALATPDGWQLQTQREAAELVVEQDAMRQVWLSAAQALMTASLLPEAIEGATEAVETAVATLAS
jgi:hypothetical protein